MKRFVNIRSLYESMGGYIKRGIKVNKSQVKSFVTIREFFVSTIQERKFLIDGLRSLSVYLSILVEDILFSYNSHVIPYLFRRLRQTPVSRHTFSSEGSPPQGILPRTFTLSSIHFSSHPTCSRNVHPRHPIPTL